MSFIRLCLSSHPPLARFRASVDCAGWLLLLDLLLLSTGLPSALGRPLVKSDGLALLHATSARAWFRRQRPATAAAGLSRLDIFPGLFYVSFWRTLLSALDIY